MYGEDEGSSSRRRSLLGACLIALGPPLVLIGYYLLFASRTITTDYFALAAAALVGIVGIGFLPLPGWARLTLAMGLLAFIYSIRAHLLVGFACAVRGLCL